METVADVLQPLPAVKMSGALKVPTKEEMHEMLAHAGAAHRIDDGLLASVVRAESGGQVKAVSRTGAKGLMAIDAGDSECDGR